MKMNYFIKAIALALVFIITFQLVSCLSIEQEPVESICETKTQSSVTGPKISISTFESSDGDGYATTTESYWLDQAVGVHTPVDYEELYVMSEHIDILQDINAFELSEISILYIDPYLVKEFLLSDSSMEMFFGFSVEDLQSEFGEVALTFSDNGSVEKGVTIVPVEESSSANPYDYKSFFSKLAVGCGIVVIGTTLSIATGGTFTCGMIAITKAALSTALIAAATTSVYQTVKGVSQGKSVAEAFEDSCEAGLNSFADGFVIGSIIGSVYTLGHPTCFVAGTPVATPTGSAPIESLAIGDIVFTKNMETGSVDQQPVLNTFVSESHEVVTLTLSDQENPIMTTRSHPFYTPTNGWTTAAQLRAGDILLSLNGECVIVEQVQHELLESPVTVFNIETASNHNYFVGDATVLVHNKCSAFEQKLRDQARQRTWADEVEAVKNGTSRYKWTPDEIEELLRTGKVSGYEVAHIVDCHVIKDTSNALFIGDPNNTVILKEIRTAGVSANPITRQHYYVHEGNWGNSTNTDKIVELLPWVKEKVEKAKLMIIPK